MNYDEFISNKVPRAEQTGFTPKTEPHESLFPHQRDIAKWCVEGGQRAVFAAFGLGKTRMHLQVAKWVAEEVPHKKYLIIAPLGVRQEFTQNDGPTMGVPLVYCRNDTEVAAAGQFIITNYERVRDGGITVNGDIFAGVGLDEASVLRSFGSKTYQTFLTLFKSVKYRFVFTATPSPNKHKELIHYGGFLGVMDTGEALTRFFKRDSTQANNLTLYPHMEERFWQWLSSWAVFMQKPSDLGYSDKGYDLPPINIHWHRVAVDHKKAWAQCDSWGQHQLFQDQSSGLKELADMKRDTAVLRLQRAIEIIGEDSPEKHWLLWHDLEVERHLIQKAIPESKAVYGSQDLEEREDLILGFARGEYRILSTKPILAGSGCNFQKHCSDAIFLGASYKFNDVIQAVHRIQRFQQSKPVNIHFIFSESEDPVVDSLKSKWKQHNELVSKMSDILKNNKLSIEIDMKLTRGMGATRKEVSGETYRVVHNDCVLELEQFEENSVDMICTSIPFGNQYEYSPNYNDFGHNPNNEAFFEQFKFLVPNLLKVLKPGRLACIHVKDRIRFGNVTGMGMPTLDRFSDKTADVFEKGGFAFMGRITIDTDVVRENNQTYRLGWTENCKDSSKMGVGCPEYVLLLRKLPTDLSNAYADLPVMKDKSIYTRAHWQIDASSFYKSDGNRLPDPEVLLNLTHENILQIWREHCKKNGYQYREHIDIGKELEKHGKLPSSFMLFPPISNHPDIWSDIVRMRTLNTYQSKRNQENHVCPLQLDIIERLINRYSNKGEIILDPFGGIGSTPYQAIKLGRKGWAIELNEEYWENAVGYCEVADAERHVPTLFDMQTLGANLVK
jgi:DNA modification methylase